MRSKVLYFPHIRIPETRWLTQMLLYWDQVGSIVPLDFLEAPESLGEFMHELVRENLVWQVVPGAHIWAIPSFSKAFEEYLGDLGSELDARVERFRAGATCPIHIEKMGAIERVLRDVGLARPARQSWYDVEYDTGQDFMCYLAASLGQLDSVNAVPVTDAESHLTRLVLAGVAQEHVDQQLNALRMQVIDKVLPMPTHPVRAVTLRAFKDQHGDDLRNFRMRVERELVELATIDDQQLRERHLELFQEEMESQATKIKTWMSNERWHSTFGKVCGLLSHLPLAGKAFGLADAVRKALKGEQSQPISMEFAYAVYIETELP